MKKNFLLIVTLAGLVSIASAASSQTDAPVVVLPTYVVNAPRYEPVEQQINARLQEFRATARTGNITLPAPSLPALHASQKSPPAPVALPVVKILAKS